jgi:hypothetical protein
MAFVDRQVLKIRGGQFVVANVGKHALVSSDAAEMGVAITWV